jgi:hypothetical protein
MDVGQLKNVCLSSVCNKFVPNYLLNRLSNWHEFFFVKTEEKHLFENFNPKA